MRNSLNTHLTIKTNLHTFEILELREAKRKDRKAIPIDVLVCVTISYHKIIPEIVKTQNNKIFINTTPVEKQLTKLTLLKSFTGAAIEPISLR